MKHYRSDKKCLNIIKAAVLIFTALLICLCTFFLSFLPILMIILNILFFAAGVFTAAIYLPIYFDNLSYHISRDGIITKESGFFFKKKQIMALDKIQYTTAVSSPFRVLSWFNFFILFAYGGTMTVMFLSKNDFEELSLKLGKRG